MSDTLLSLADRVEGATDLSWKEVIRLNQEIHDTTPDPKTIIPPDYLRSLDAATTLVPEGWGWMVVSDDCATVFRRRETGGMSAPESVIAATPALALTAAALRARATLQGREDKR